MKIINFDEAIKQAGEKKHLLLGNGFSIAFKKDIFSYKTLYEECLKSKDISNKVKKLFDKFKTNDFEIIIKNLNDAARVLDIYSKNKDLIKQLKDDANILKETLVKLLSDKHPSYPGEITDTQYEQCIKFINNFDTIYTLNYDLLLYWVIMKNIGNGNRKYNDGFGYVDNQAYVAWKPEGSNRPNVFYLHGALHLFDAGSEIIKFTWINTGIKLIKQIREELKKDHFPLFVAEGSSQEKMTKINHSQYLGKGIRSFSQIGGSLFIYGHSLSENDSHYLDFISKGKIKKLFISLYNDGTEKQKKINLEIESRAEQIKNKSSNIEIIFYDASSAKVWGE